MAQGQVLIRAASALGFSHQRSHSRKIFGNMAMTKIGAGAMLLSLLFGPTIILQGCDSDLEETPSPPTPSPPPSFNPRRRRASTPSPTPRRVESEETEATTRSPTKTSPPQDDQDPGSQGDAVTPSPEIVDKWQSEKNYDSNNNNAVSANDIKRYNVNNINNRRQSR